LDGYIVFEPLAAGVGERGDGGHRAVTGDAEIGLGMAATTKSARSYRRNAILALHSGAYSFLATVEKVLVRLLPTVVNTVTAATEISAAMRPHSIAVAQSLP
jgi:hypothetical protein